MAEHMFLSATLERNQGLIAAAADLHRQGSLPPGTYVVDLDTIATNARLLAAAAKTYSLRLYFVAKHIGRNPLVVAAVATHIPAATAIDVQEARRLLAAGARLGNVGHLVQPPESSLLEVLGWRAEVVTLFSFAKARSLAQAAAASGVVQPVLLRVVGERDVFYPGQEGGIPVERLEAAARRIVQELPAIRVVGVTSFPCLLFDDQTRCFKPTPNLETLLQAREALERCGLPITQVNAPSGTCVGTMPLLADLGVTHAEPGHALTGTTPLHAADLSQPERPALVYVSEVTHLLADGRPAIIGGGFYARGRARSALVHGCETNRPPLRLPVLDSPADSIDYYRTLAAPFRPDAVQVGDTAILAFRAQAFVSRAPVAVVAGLADGRPQLTGLFDPAGRPL
jgi:predicted amino acid racemase